MRGNIAIIAALGGELAPLVHHRTAGSWRRLGSGPDMKMWEYRHPDGCWLAVCAGMGGGRAALAFAEAEKLMALDAVCSVGWAGALSETFAAGMVCSPSEIVDTATGERFRPADWSADWPVLASSPHVADEVEKRRLAVTYRAELVDMEAATLARIARGRSIPFYCKKAISDEAGARLPNMNPFIDPLGQIRMLPFLLRTAMRPSEWVPLAKLGRHSAAAARNLAESLYDWLDARACIRGSKGDSGKVSGKD